ncbi:MULTISPECIES: leucine-rich repeat domain-containing protein [unclassified Paenibacillus]|uniref:Leucine-rich repeat domain-containing protein n=1 Tax=Paenibacillus provencensis TaxID=441151 RepID=A0ABW3PTK0_9BACL|nr:MULTISPECIES: leucine-rich repeat domain-containing protein [unclassified Paenibacillus]MCM3128584.1 leucine-rich repeat domain-containing protein [Paenibacillus sp. MER 78]SFS77314.1 Leucine Rich repeat-containing protein [Paenibacillus sp. 453mf]
MGKYISIILIFLIISMSVAGQASFAKAYNEEIFIEDEALSYGLKSILNKPANEPLTAEDLASLTVVDLRSLGIKSLAGLEHAVNMTHLRLSGNEISDLAPISEIETLREVDVRNNYVTSIEELAGLTDLGRLYISNNGVASIEAVRNFPRLHTLLISGNPVQSLNALEEAKALSWLEATDNGITDISVLAELPSLRYIQLDNNHIENLSPLEHLTETLEGISMNNNEITDIAPLASLTSLRSIKLANNQIYDLAPLEDLAELSELQLSGNRIWDISPLADHDFIYFPANRNGNVQEYYSLGLADNYLDLSEGSDTLDIFEKITANDRDKRSQGELQRLIIGSSTAYAGSVGFPLESAPYISDNRTYVPLRFAAEQLGADVEWNQDLSEVTIQNGETTIRWREGSRQVDVDGRIERYDVPLMKQHGSLFVPVRFISDQLNADTAFINKTKTTLIFD